MPVPQPSEAPKTELAPGAESEAKPESKDEEKSVPAALAGAGTAAASIVLPSLTVKNDDASSTHATTGSEPPEMPTPISAVEPVAATPAALATPATASTAVATESAAADSGAAAAAEDAATVQAQPIAGVTTTDVQIQAESKETKEETQVESKTQAKKEAEEQWQDVDKRVPSDPAAQLAPSQTSGEGSEQPAENLKPAEDTKLAEYDQTLKKHESELREHEQVVEAHREAV